MSEERWGIPTDSKWSGHGDVDRSFTLIQLLKECLQTVHLESEMNFGGQRSRRLHLHPILGKRQK